MPVYIELFNGRSYPKEVLNNWGERGPIFGPFDYFHTTYSCEIKFGDGHVLSMVDDLVYYDGTYYGDWSVFSDSVIHKKDSLKGRLQSFDPAKATLPADLAGTPLHTHEELVLAFRNGTAQLVVDRIHHEEYVLGGVRYFCGWQSRSERLGVDVASWFVYKAEPEPSADAAVTVPA